MQGDVLKTDFTSKVRVTTCNMIRYDTIHYVYSMQRRAQ